MYNEIPRTSLGQILISTPKVTHHVIREFLVNQGWWSVLDDNGNEYWQHYDWIGSYFESAEAAMLTLIKHSFVFKFTNESSE